MGYKQHTSFPSLPLESTADRRRPLSCVHSFMMVFSAQLAGCGGARPPSFTLSTPSTRVMSPPHTLAQNRYFITTQVMLGLRGQYSKVAMATLEYMLSSGFHCVMFTL
jgi:hypothetical protein